MYLGHTCTYSQHHSTVVLSALVSYAVVRIICALAFSVPVLGYRYPGFDYVKKKEKQIHSLVCRFLGETVKKVLEAKTSSHI